MKCPTCAKDGYEPTSYPVPSTARYPVPSTDVIHILKTHPDLKNQEWIDFLSKLPRLPDISQGQRNFFGVIHKQLLGSYPPRDGEAKPAPSPLEKMSLNPEDLPF